VRPSGVPFFFFFWQVGRDARRNEILLHDAMKTHFRGPILWQADAQAFGSLLNDLSERGRALTISNDAFYARGEGMRCDPDLRA